MAEKKITRKVISPSKKDAQLQKKAPVKEEVSEVATSAKEAEAAKTPNAEETVRVKKVCFFDKNKSEPSYTDIATLRRFTTDRAKIVPKLKSGLCAKHQRVLTREIKYARHLGLLPFTPKV